RQPVLRIVWLDLRRMARSSVRFLQSPEPEQRSSQPAPGERQMRRLSERVTQQPLGVRRHIRGQRYGGAPAQRSDVSRILAQDVTEQLLGLAALIGEQRRRGFLDARALWIGEARALERDSSLLGLSEIDERVAVGEPGTVMMGLHLQYPA